MISVSLVDDSLSLPITDAAEPVIHQVSINIFCKKKEDLPRLYRMGDVLRMHRVELKVRKFKGCCVWNRVW
jgi:hypothetical protein